MTGIVPEARHREKEQIRKQIRSCGDANLRIRFLILCNLWAGRFVEEIVEVLQTSRSNVYRTAARYREDGEEGLIDGRRNNGKRKVDAAFRGALFEVVNKTPLDHGWRRPTWTRELLVETLVRKTGVRIHPSTMSHVLKSIGARRGAARPVVGCPWSKTAKNKRLREIRQLIKTLPGDEVAFYEDEVDVHLNPKIGLDWMNRGEQKQVTTPGKNQKRYLAGSLDVRSRELIWVESDRKDTMLFIQMLWKLTQHTDAKTIHVILDNYCIHSTKTVDVSLQTSEGQRIRLHFLPPYCPEHNKIERVWRDLHSSVTRNHQCETMTMLMHEVRYWLRKRNQKTFKASKTRDT